MADPYATKAPDLSGRPTGPPPWAGAITERGGEPVGAAPGSADAVFRVIYCRGIGTLAPFARVDPALAVLLWLEHAPAERSAEAGNRLLAELRGSESPVFAIKQGCVGGPAERAGCFGIDEGLVLSALDGALSDAIGWERDPDFDYDLPPAVPGVEGDAARALLPRLLYGDHDRVYEHATLVAAKKRERAEVAGALAGLDPAVAGASGWPPVATATDWRD